MLKQQKVNQENRINLEKKLFLSVCCQVALSQLGLYSGFLVAVTGAACYSQDTGLNPQIACGVPFKAGT